jgi:hypothetical protein
MKDHAAADALVEIIQEFAKMSNTQWPAEYCQASATMQRQFAWIVLAFMAQILEKHGFDLSAFDVQLKPLEDL